MPTRKHCHDSLATGSVTDLFQEWEKKLKEAGLSMHAGQSSRVKYSADPETFPTKTQKRDRSHRRRAKFIKTCACGCGQTFTGNAKRTTFNASCRKRLERARHNSLATVSEGIS